VYFEYRLGRRTSRVSMNAKGSEGS